MADNLLDLYEKAARHLERLEREAAESERVAEGLPYAVQSDEQELARQLAGRRQATRRRRYPPR
jgi:hypothetical protein